MIANEEAEVPPDAVHSEMLEGLFDRGVQLLLKHMPAVRRAQPSVWGAGA